MGNYEKTVALWRGYNIRENGKISEYMGELHALFEQQNQKMCYEFLRPRIAAKEPLKPARISTLNLSIYTRLRTATGAQDEHSSTTG